MAHRLMGYSLFMIGGDYDKGLSVTRIEAIAIYNPTDHPPLATRFGQDTRVSVLCQRSWSLWTLGYPDKALADAETRFAMHGRLVTPPR